MKIKSIRPIVDAEIMEIITKCLQDDFNDKEIDSMLCTSFTINGVSFQIAYTNKGDSDDKIHTYNGKYNAR